MMVIARIVVCFVLAFFAALFVLDQTRGDAYERQRDHLEGLKDRYVFAKSQLLHHDAVRAQLHEMKVALDGLTKVLPAEIDMSFAPVLAAARRHHLNIETSAVGRELDREFYTARGIGISVTGGFHDLGAFAAELGKAPGCLILDSLNVSPVPGGKVRLQGVVWAHRYLSDAERARLRKAAEARKS